jgi:hypothetical protein
LSAGWSMRSYRAGPGTGPTGGACAGSWYGAAEGTADERVVALDKDNGAAVKAPKIRRKRERLAPGGMGRFRPGVH